MTVCTGEKLSEKARGGFLRRNIYVILAFLVPAAIMFAVFAVRQYFPFGNRMIMVIDSWHQYYPFLVEYQRMLKEGASVLYSWNTGGGANFLGIIANYLGSPLYLLSYFVPSGTPWLQAFLALTVVLRIGVAGMSFAIFLRKVFNRNDLSLVTFSLMYALCAYMLGYYWNMMWLDTVAIMPLVIAGVIGVLRDRKFARYIISLALSVMFSFYIGYMVCLFVLLAAVCYTVVSFVSFKHSLKNAGKMVIYTAIAFMLTAAVTVPAYMALSASDSAGAVSSFPLKYTINYGYGYEEDNLLNTLFAIARTATNLLAYTRPIKVDQGLPNIACGVLSLVLIFFYVTNKKIKLREKIVSGSLCVFFLLSFVINQLNYIWHGMSTPAMVYYRWSFIFSFVIVVLAYRAFTLIDCINKKTFIVSSALVVLYLIAAFFLQRKLSVAITAVAAVAILLGVALYRMGKLRYRVLSVLLCLFVVCEMSLSAYYASRVVGFTKNDDYPQNYAEVTELVETAEDINGEDAIYRTEFTDTHTLNDGALYSTYGITTFNSMVDSTYADFLAEAGLASSMINNRYAYLETTPVINTFLNVRYIISRDGKTAVDTEHLNVVATTDECTMYESTSYVPMGFMTSTDLLQYQLHDTSQLPIDTQNEIFSLATGIEENVLKIVEPTVSLTDESGEAVQKNEDNPLFYLYDLSKEEKSEATEDEVAVTVEYEIDTQGSYYGMFYSSSVDDATVTVNGDSENSLTLNQSYAYMAALGGFESGDRVTVQLGAAPGEKSSMASYLVRIDEDVLNRGLEKLREDTMTVTDWDDRSLAGTISVDEAGLFYTSVFYDEGWTAYVDGKEIEITPVADTFIAFELSEGEHTIELEFTPKGLYAGAAISAVGVLLFTILCIVVKTRRKRIPVNAESECTQESTDTELETDSNGADPVSDELSESSDTERE